MTDVLPEKLSKKLPIGIQDFPKLRENGYHYVDKTKFIWQMVQTGLSQVFLSRPRRFGKSLFLSTLAAYFEGRKDLFEGLALRSLEKDWVVHPVLRLDLNAEKYDSADSVAAILNRHLEKWEAIYGGDSSRSSSERFAFVIEAAHKKTGKPAVVLVDEYDKPLLATIGKGQLHEDMKEALKPFYGVLKSVDAHLRFVFLTGVTKFGQVSVFSDLNQLKDISLDHRFATLCGITEEELLRDFEPEIQGIANKNKWSFENAVLEIRKMYNGYKFEEDAQGVYNPFSTLNALDTGKLESYWFQTGTPTFLVQLLQETNFDLRNVDGIKLSADQFIDYQADADKPLPVIYQSGYITIQGYNPRRRIYKLGYPNAEVKFGFLNFVTRAYIPQDPRITGLTVADFADDVELGRVEQFVERIRTFFKGMPYELNNENERHYQVVLYLIFKLTGQFVDTEVRFADGRADAIVQCPEYVYIFEFKYNRSAEEAMEQINQKGYADPYKKDKRKVYKVAMNFSSETRNLDDCLIELA